MTYIVVLFPGTLEKGDEFEVGRESWLVTSKSIRWPKRSLFQQAIRNEKIKPNDSWAMFDIKLLKSGFSKFS